MVHTQAKYSYMYVYMYTLKQIKQKDHLTFLINAKIWSSPFCTKCVFHNFILFIIVEAIHLFLAFLFVLA